MAFPTEKLIKRLIAAREKRGMSQRSFAKSIGIPQSRLSRIESGKIDPQMSNMLELGRLHGMELMFIPDSLVPIVQSMIRQLDHPEKFDSSTPLYSLDNNEEDDDF